ncbi:MAG: sulfite exporter TauE/SafE family protein [Methanobacterium sp.]|uniref:sulfite exporter TauE/SafE family protein n=1 Tax=Methanobacterium sp. TaxID=2164 RepID=UPI003D65A0E0|nr:sulfite exporter TauE/SafE family protein [Methanobacterium sp.]
MESYIFYILILIITGAGIGFLSGLLGVGGGFIMVPIQFWLLTSMGVDPTVAIRISLGTSLAVILPTAISGAYGHYRKNAVLIKPTAFLAVTGMMGGILGGIIATNISGDVLQIIFGLAALIVAFKMLVMKYPEINEKPIDKTIYYIFGGLFVGIMSGLLGVGGGFIVVPFMVILMRYDIHKAIGTSTAVIVFTSIGGIISYIFNGWGMQGLPQYSLGYVNLLQLVLLAGASIPMAQIGVKTAHKLSSRKLNYIFVGLMILIGLKMIGVI